MQVTEELFQVVLRAIDELQEAVVEAVRDAGSGGILETHLHLALLQIGAPASLPKHLIDALVERKVLRRHGYRIRLVDHAAPTRGRA